MAIAFHVAIESDEVQEAAKIRLIQDDIGRNPVTLLIVGPLVSTGGVDKLEIDVVVKNAGVGEGVCAMGCAITGRTLAIVPSTLPEDELDSVPQSELWGRGGVHVTYQVMP